MANPIIDRARAHFAGQGTHSIEVPEWGDDAVPLVIYWTPITCAERQKIAARYKDGHSQEALVYAIIIKAKSANGDMLFTLEDKQALMTGVDVSVIDRIAAEILATPTIEDAEKN